MTNIVCGHTEMAMVQTKSSRGEFNSQLKGIGGKPELLKVLVFCLFVQISESCTWEFWDTFLPSAVEVAVMNIPHLTHGQVVVDILYQFQK